MTKRRHNFGTKRFKEKSLFIFHARIALKSLILLFVRLIARGARIRKTHTQTDTQDKYCNPLAHARRGLITDIAATIIIIFNPRRACARVTVLVLSVCVCVCFPYSGTSRNQAYKQQYQRLQRDTGMKYKKGFFFKTLRSEVMASFTHLE